ncbi:MAG TPA: Hsp20/alpha crystallin family protein [Steroidobacteraceae bacterium]|nr:Hsp20/alpha crystallin family protein [Steroidobacteraceae bacterium]
MSIVRWEPFAEMDSLFNRLAPTMFNRWPTRLGGSNGNNVEWAPSADISETDKEYLIRAELPAVKKEDVKVTVDDGLITIEGERRQQKEDKNEKMHRVESFYGHFTRSFSLPDSIEEGAIRCESKDGVLTVHIPKAQTPKQQPKQIKVE